MTAGCILAAFASGLAGLFYVGDDMNPELTEHERRSLQKPEKGSARAGRVKARERVEDAEERHKTKARKRDSYFCRVPGCDCARRRDFRLEVAHVEDKKMGGDHGLRSDTDNLLSVCSGHHRGAPGVPSLHGKDLRVEPLTDKGCDGPCDFYAREGNGWVSIGRELYVGVLAHD